MVKLCEYARLRERRGPDCHLFKKNGECEAVTRFC
jgi:hypothetical protein